MLKLLPEMSPADERAVQRADAGGHPGDEHRGASAGPEPAISTPAGHGHQNRRARARDFRPYKQPAHGRMLMIMKQYDVRTEARNPQATAVARATLTVAEIGPWLGKIYGAIAGLLAGQQAGPAGPPFARYHMLGEGRFEVEAGFPATAPIEGNDGIQPSELPGGQVAVTIHTGRYDAMQPAYQALLSWVGEHGAELSGDPWEVYLSDPAAEPDPATWRTQIVQPYRQA